ncbi:hypothetical protein D7322_03410 [Sphingobacterium puteale]|uniref:Uncharacterized protein n=1 Tax=Sphingobacterium puteale TaxID=2420510 RepID=A0A420W3D2_9SPHI|nr:hypothetical protein D7322_03410 [Sphingobacterium puteale]
MTYTLLQLAVKIIKLWFIINSMAISGNTFLLQEERVRLEKLDIVFAVCLTHSEILWQSFGGSSGLI